jgi:hypothetical protein
MKKSIQKLCLFTLAIVFAFTTKAQSYYCAKIDSSNNVYVSNSPCLDLSGYINPAAPVTFNVNFHFFRPTLTSPIRNKYHDFYKNATAADCDTMVKILNERMAHLHAPDDLTSPAASPNYTDSYIRYNLVKDITFSHGQIITTPHVYFHVNDTGFMNGYGRNAYIYDHFGEHKDTEINIFFTSDSTQLGTGVGNYGYTMISGIEWADTSWRHTHIGDLQMQLHELGHTAGILNHTNKANVYMPSNVPVGFNYPSIINTDYYQENDCGCQFGGCGCPTWGNVPSKSQGGVASNNIMGYNNDRTYLSPNQIGSFFYSVYSGANRNFTSAPHDPCVYDSSQTINITSPQTWTAPTDIIGDLVVKAGNLLTIKCKVSFSPGSRLIVEPTAKLVLDGGILTANCSGIWPGVQVWGNSSQAQTISRSFPNVGMPFYQGMVSIINGGSIQKARVGITTIAKYNNGNLNWNKTGGIIQAVGANFVSNSKDVEFMYYQYAVSQSYFKTCTFNQSSLPTGSVPDDRVSLYGISGVNFYGNTFTTSYAPGNGYLANAITSSESSYNVSDYSGTGTTITGFLYGVYAQNSSIFGAVNVSASNFSKIQKGGIYLSGAYYSTLTANFFTMNGTTSTTTLPDYGIYVDNSHGYSIRENTLRLPVLAPIDMVHYHGGIFIHNSGAGANSVYNNSFSTLNYGLWSQEQNQGSSPTPGATGLVMNCNDFIGCSYNIGVVGTAGNSATGIAKIQGLHNVPAQYARNTYDVVSCTAQNKYNIDGNQGYALTHASFVGATYQPTPQQTCSDSSRIKVQQDAGTYNKTTYCPTTCAGCRTIPQVHQNLTKNKIQLANLSSVAEDANGSVANQKQTLQDQVIYEQNELGNLANEKIRNFLNDTTLQNPMDSVIAVLKQKHNANYKKQLAAAYIHKADFINAQAYLDSFSCPEIS